jgi:hypothetical protein
LLQAVLKEGGKYVVVPGQLPTGCIPIVLTLYPSTKERDYDAQTGCLRIYNTLVRYHNKALLEAVRLLRIKYPDARIIYADYYAPVTAFLKAPARFGQYFFICSMGGQSSKECSRLISRLNRLWNELTSQGSVPRRGSACAVEAADRTTTTSPRRAGFPEPAHAQTQPPILTGMAST